MRGPPHHPTGVVCGTPPCISQIPLLLIPSQSRVPGFMVSQRNPTSCGVTNSPPPPHLRSHPSTSLHPRASGPGRPSPEGPFPSTLQVPKNPDTPPPTAGDGDPSPNTLQWQPSKFNQVVPLSQLCPGLWGGQAPCLAFLLPSPDPSTHPPPTPKAKKPGAPRSREPESSGGAGTPPSPCQRSRAAKTLLLADPTPTAAVV